MGCPDIISLTEKFLMARKFFRIFTENNPVMGSKKTFFIPEAKGLTKKLQTGHTANFGKLDKAILFCLQDKILI